MTFARPEILWLLLVVPPAMAVFFWWSGRTRRKLMTQFIQARLLPGLTAGLSPARERIRNTALILATVGLLLAFARPQWGFRLEEVTQKGLDIIVALDTSKSMLAQDIAPNRLERAKLAIRDLMHEAKFDRLGLVAFAGTAFLQCPPTVDEVAFRQSLEALDVNTLPQGGTALAEAIETAAKAFKESDTHKVIVLFTDGEDHESGAAEAAQKAKDSGAILFTVGVGTEKGDLLRATLPNGQTNILRDESGNAVLSRLNPALLETIAGPRPGFYLPLRGANPMQALYERGLAPIPKSESKEKWVRQPRERYHWPLGVAIALLMGEFLFPLRKRESRPGRGMVSMKSAVPLIAVLALFIPHAAIGSPGTALQAYRNGRFKEALQEYERLASLDSKRKMQLLFNAGDAAYRGTNYEAALKHFSAALASKDVNLQASAYYNIGNTQYQLGAQADDLNKVEDLWRQSVKSFKNSLAINATDSDARHNLEFVRSQVNAIEQLKEAIRRALQDANLEVRRHNYHRALEIMEQQIQNNIAAKPFKDYAERLRNIDEIATPQP